MNTQPEALRLADRLDLWGDQGDLLEAAAELRRLHEEVQEQCRLNGMGSEREARLMAINQELLSALKLANAMLAGVNMNAKVVERKVRAAINKATGEQA